MEKFDEMEHEVKCFKKYVYQTIDLMIDAYKWKKIAHCTDNEMSKRNYEEISNKMMEMFKEQHNKIEEMLKD